MSMQTESPVSETETNAENARPLIQVRGREVKRQADYLSERFGVSVSEVTRMAVAKLYMDVIDGRNVKGE
jgi:antitoxin component of RelBE/YafQ-DinJ toxin-antitoxin module